MASDKVDEILKQWSQARPNLDCSAMGVVGRLRLTSNIWTADLEVIFKQFDLSNIEFDILATLRRSNQAITPTELYNTLMLSSGAVSTRIEQLVQRGFVERIASEHDRRSVKVNLTASGLALIDQAVEAHVANMDTMLNALDTDEQAQLASLLKKILVAQAS
ncbi:MarR family winged helix-turn-helix transcriptional regulator [Thalassotalea fusca]